MKRTVLSLLLAVVLVAVIVAPLAAASANQTIGVNVVLNVSVSQSHLTGLGKLGKVRDVVYQLRAVTMQTTTGNLPLIRALPYVASVSPDAVRNGRPIDTVSATDFSSGINTWDLDAVNVTDLGASSRQVPYDGSGVYVAVLDTGLVQVWRQYFPEERIATQYALAFGGGGGNVGWVSSQPNKWERDTNSHGTHVASTIIGYKRTATVAVNGVAPLATIIPVKVLNQNGSGWSSVIARGIVYVADLKAGALASSPVIINMSLGGPTLDPMESAAIDYAISKGVIIVASAGNEGEAGMGYPGAYAPVISVAASGWVGEWLPGSDDDPRNWWRADDVPDPFDAANFYITDFSSRELAAQDLDVAAPGSWIVGPYQANSGQITYYYLSGTSMASPHVAGIVALMAQKRPGLTAAQAEGYLEAAAATRPLPAGCRDIVDPNVGSVEVCWEDDATGAGLIMADTALAATP